MGVVTMSNALVWWLRITLAGALARAGGWCMHASVRAHPLSIEDRMAALFDEAPADEIVSQLEDAINEVAEDLDEDDEWGEFE